MFYFLGAILGQMVKFEHALNMDSVTINFLDFNIVLWLC